jgi:23S rRNA (adenine2030-N6)-methyltransferase
MNYRHAYHAGNFADVLKHAVLALAIAYLKRKEAPFRIIDTHAGAGRYRLTSGAAEKTQEWRAGIARLIGEGAAPPAPEVARALAPYLDAVRAENGNGRLDVYPGSPCLSLRLMRGHDVLIANELHPEDRAQLKTALGRDRRAKVMELDGWVALRALLPPKERRGIVLIDPPFEEEGELARCAEGLVQGLQRFASGVFMVWYPIKDPKPVARFHDGLRQQAIPKLLTAELMIRRPSDPQRLNGCGLVIANPPYSLLPELNVILPTLVSRLGNEAGARHRLEWLDAPKTSPTRDLRRPRPIRSKP